MKKRYNEYLAYIHIYICLNILRWNWSRDPDTSVWTGADENWSQDHRYEQLQSQHWYKKWRSEYTYINIKIIYTDDNYSWYIWTDPKMKLKPGFKQNVVEAWVWEKGKLKHGLDLNTLNSIEITYIRIKSKSLNWNEIIKMRFIIKVNYNLNMDHNF